MLTRSVCSMLSGQTSARTPLLKHIKRSISVSTVHKSISCCLLSFKTSCAAAVKVFWTGLLSERSRLYSLFGVRLGSPASSPVSLFQSLRPSGSLVSSSKLPVPSTNSSYVVFSWNGRGPSSSTMSALSSTSFSSRRFPTWGWDQEWTSAPGILEIEQEPSQINYSCIYKDENIMKKYFCCQSLQKMKIMDSSHTNISSLRFL